MVDDSMRTCFFVLSGDETASSSTVVQLPLRLQTTHQAKAKNSNTMFTGLGRLVSNAQRSLRHGRGGSIVGGEGCAEGVSRRHGQGLKSMHCSTVHARRSSRSGVGSRESGVGSLNAMRDPPCCRSGPANAPPPPSLTWLTGTQGAGARQGGRQTRQTCPHGLLGLLSLSSRLHMLAPTAATSLVSDGGRLRVQLCAGLDSSHASPSSPRS